MLRRIAIVAGESSGDRLGAGLLASLRQYVPDIEVEGVAGPKMIAAGCHAIEPMERLALMGLFEIARHYFELRAMREQLIERWLADPPDLFIGIDAPEFNLGLEERLRRRGIKTVHYVSPQVWAWREGRLAQIRRGVDLLLTLFPFEEHYFQDHDIPVKFVGHPLADEIPMVTEKLPAREKLDLPVDKTIIALLPGSRRNEWRYHVELFLKTALWCRARLPDLHFAVPLVNQKAWRIFDEARASIAPDLAISLFHGQAQQVVGAADVVLTVSGTATLETLLLRRPMVIAYRMSWVSYVVVGLLIKIEHISLPNLLAGRSLVPEMIQTHATPPQLGAEVLRWLDHPELVEALESEFTDLHTQLRQDANNSAAKAVAELLMR